MDAWQSAMRRGDFAAAWAVSDALLARDGPALRDPALPDWVRRFWDGRPLDGLRVLVDCRHGLGDSLQFARLLPLLRPRVRHLALRMQAPLVPLFDAAALADTVVPHGHPPPAHDALVELMELPHILRLRLEDIPAPGPLRLAAGIPRQPGSRLELGLCWAGGDWDPSRHLPDRLAARLAAAPGVRCWSLQLDQPVPGFAAGSLAGTDLLGQSRAMLERLDLVISVDTMSAHLSASLGLPTWLLLPSPCDWRWMDQGERSPWYPTMRLFRQPQPGAWDPVAEAVLRALGKQPALNRGLPLPGSPRLHAGPVSRNAVGHRATP